MWFISSGCPTNATCTLTPNPVTLPSNGSAVSTLSVTAAANTPTGAYIVTITGTGRTMTGPHSTQVAVNVIPSTQDFTITVTPTSLTVPRGTSGAATVTVSGVGASSSVTLSASGNPAKTSISFAPNPVTATTGGATSAMTVTAQSKGPKGLHSEHPRHEGRVHARDAAHAHNHALTWNKVYVEGDDKRRRFFGEIRPQQLTG